MKTKIKLTITAVLAALNVYLIYALIANMVVWLNQPRFILPDGTSTASMGFIVQLLVYSGIFLIAAAALIITSIIFYRRRKE